MGWCKYWETSWAPSIDIRSVVFAEPRATAVAAEENQKVRERGSRRVKGVWK